MTVYFNMGQMKQQSLRRGINYTLDIRRQRVHPCQSPWTWNTSSPKQCAAQKKAFLLQRKRNREFCLMVFILCVCVCFIFIFARFLYTKTLPWETWYSQVWNGKMPHISHHHILTGMITKCRLSLSELWCKVQNVPEKNYSTHQITQHIKFRWQLGQVTLELNRKAVGKFFWKIGPSWTGVRLIHAIDASPTPMWQVQLI